MAAKLHQHGARQQQKQHQRPERESEGAGKAGGARADAPAPSRPLYDVLGVAPTASMVDIRKAYKQRALETHPDRNAAPTATEDFKRLAHAHAVLTSPSKRREYDACGKVAAR